MPGEPVDLVWMRTVLESKLKSILQYWVANPGMSKDIKILNSKLRWHDGVGISCEADQNMQKQSSARQDHPI